MVAGAATHVPLVLGADALDTDRALVLMMAEAFARGEFSLYFWNQNYMAAVEPLLLTPLAWLGVATPIMAAWVGLGLTVILAAASIRLARSLGAAWWFVALLWAVPPVVVAHHHVALYGARLVATLAAFTAFLIGLRARSHNAWIGVGVIAGLAFMGDHLMVVWVVGIAYVALRAGHLRALATGALPVVALDMIASVMTPAVHLAGPNDPRVWIRTPIDLVSTALPQLLGFILSRGPGPDFEPPAAVVPDGALWLLLVIPGAITWAVLAGSAFRRPSEAPAEPSERGPGSTAPLGLGLVCLASVAIFLLVGGDGERWSMRYLVPTWPALSVLAALAVARWPSRLRPLAALVALPALFTHVADSTWPRPASGALAREEAQDVAAVVRDAGVETVWADYWDTYRFNHLLGSEPRWVTLSVLDRRPEWTEAAYRASPVGYLLRRTDARRVERLDGLARGPVGTTPPVDVGRYRFYVLPRTEPGLETTGETPGRIRAAAAATAPAFMFLGVLVLAGLSARLVSRPPRAG